MRTHLYKKSRKRRSKRSMKRRSKQSIKRRSKRSTKRRSKQSMKRRSKRSTKIRSKKTLRKKYSRVIDGMFGGDPDDKEEKARTVSAKAEEYDSTFFPFQIEMMKNLSPDEKGALVEMMEKGYESFREDEILHSDKSVGKDELGEKIEMNIKEELVEPYGKEIYDAYRIKEKNPNSFPLLLQFDRQKIINKKMIKILLDWINDLIIFYKFPRVYLYNTINYLKRYINITPDIQRPKLQLVGIVCFTLAIKLYDRYPDADSITDTEIYVPMITDKAYTPKESVAMEWSVFKSLKYEMIIPTPGYFFDIYKTLIPLSEEEKEKSQFLVEYPNYMFMESYLPSLISLAAILLSKRINYSELSEDIKTFLDLSEYDGVLLYKYIGELKKFYTEKFKGDYKESIEKLFK
jgi:hypothetical protein